MNNIKYTLCLGFLLLIFFEGKSQKIINADLLKLTELSFSENPNLTEAFYSIEASKADLQIQESIFDYKLYSELAYNRSNYRLFSQDPRNEFIDKYLKTNVGSVNLGVQKLFKSGLRSEANIGYQLNNDNLPYDGFGEGIDPFVYNHGSSITLKLTQPLLRGGGECITLAPIYIQELSIKNRKGNSKFINSYETSLVGYAYWEYVKNFKNLDIYIENENRIEQILSITQELVNADKKAASELIQAQADLARQKKLTEIAMQSLYNSKIELGLTVGLSSENSKLISSPYTNFPIVLDGFKNLEMNIDSLSSLAYAHRGDVEALDYRYQIAKTELKIAENNLKPQLDVSLLIDYSGQESGNDIRSSFSSFINNEGRNIGLGIGIRYSIPVQNNWGKGNVARSLINIQDIENTSDNLKRRITLRINMAINNLKINTSIFERAREALKLNQLAYENEKEKFTNGLTTLLNLILFQERLTYSELEYIQSQQQLANSIIALRFETGTLIQQVSDSDFTIRKNAFTTIPIEFINK